MSPDIRARWASATNDNIKPEPQVNASQFPTASRVATVKEPALTSAELEEQQQKTFQLQTLLQNTSPKMLEDSVEQGVKLLDRLKAPLAAKIGNSPDAEQWIQQIDNLRKQAVKTRTIIGEFSLREVPRASYP